MARTLKVFRTAAGFHDAYVAAPSQKAALEAWGADRNLFGTGMAEVVTDPRLTKAPLAKPGEVIKVKRGTERDHLAALPKRSPKPRAKPSPDTAVVRPRPRRTALDRAERAVQAAEAARDKDVEQIDREIAALQTHRRDIAEGHRGKIERAEEKRSVEADRYDAAIETWRNE